MISFSFCTEKAMSRPLGSKAERTRSQHEEKLAGQFEQGARRSGRSPRIRNSVGWPPQDCGQAFWTGRGHSPRCFPPCIPLAAAPAFKEAVRYVGVLSSAMNSRPSPITHSISRPNRRQHIAALVEEYRHRHWASGTLSLFEEVSPLPTAWLLGYLDETTLSTQSHSPMSAMQTRPPEGRPSLVQTAASLQLPTRSTFRPRRLPAPPGSGGGSGRYSPTDSA